MTFDISLHEVCVRVGVRYVITKFSQMDSLPNFLTHGAPQARARAPLLSVPGRGLSNTVDMIRVDRVNCRVDKCISLGELRNFLACLDRKRRRVIVYVGSFLIEPGIHSA